MLILFLNQILGKTQTHAHTLLPTYVIGLVDDVRTSFFLSYNTHDDDDMGVIWMKMYLGDVRKDKENKSQKWNLNIYKVGSLSLERFYVVLLLRFHDGSELEERFPVLT